MKIKSLIAASLIALSSVPYVAQAQQGSSRGGINALPPALRAAVLSGNGNAVAQAIRSLAGNNGQQAANLANQVAGAAEALLATNPQAAIAAATAAVETVQNTQVQTSGPSQTQSVIATAARIFVSPNALNVAPNQAAALATATLQVAQATGNPTLAAAVASQAVSVAEKVLTTNPATAVALASAAVQTIRSSESVARSAPTQSLETVTAAARIIVNPSAQQANPQAVAGIATAVAQIASSPAVYRASPQAAIQAMANSYSAVTSQVVFAAAPQAAQSVTQTLNQASRSTSLSSVNPATTSLINSILANTFQPGQNQAQNNQNQQNGENPFGTGLGTVVPTVTQPPCSVSCSGPV